MAQGARSGANVSSALRRWDGLEKAALADAIYAFLQTYYAQWSEAASRWFYRAFYGLCLLTALLIGEVLALLALMDAHPEKTGEPRPVFGAVMAGLVGIGVVALFGNRDKRAA